VLVVKQDGTVEARIIEVSRAVGDKWMVTSGLAAGERIVVEGLQKARPGTKVKAMEAAAVAGNQTDADLAAPQAAQVAPAPEAAKIQTAQIEEARPAATSEQPTPAARPANTQPGQKSAQQ
ncbi:MAG: hypothetical protein Q7I92_14995, partial [Humidesulfovibrio sp.]|nr:hypothetical protein [Humidesulfovibrio sp.]